MSDLDFFSLGTGICAKTVPSSELDSFSSEVVGSVCFSELLNLLSLLGSGDLVSLSCGISVSSVDADSGPLEDGGRYSQLKHVRYLKFASLF